MDVRRQSSMEKQKFVGLATDQNQNQGQESLTAMLVEGQACRLLDKDQLLCRQCAEYVREREK